MPYSIKFIDVSKAYTLGSARQTLRETISRAPSRLLRRQRTHAANTFWALKKVSLEVECGEAVGVIGPNGAGKTTILKLISRITRPTAGRMEIRGKVSALIELGAGFHPDLSGRENIFLNAAILGMSRRELASQFDEIIAFSGLEQFLDTPVKRYSAGMYVRLAFSVAAHVATDILLVDEVLAVGDLQFRQRCLDRIKRLRTNGVTIIFVSHDFYQIEAISERCLFLADGSIETCGGVGPALRSYEKWRQSRAIPSVPVAEQCNSSDEARIRAVEVRDADGNRPIELESGDLAAVWVRYETNRVIQEPNFYVKIVGAEGTCCMVRTSNLGSQMKDLQGSGWVRIVIDPIQLTPGVYSVSVELMEGLDPIVLSQYFSDRFRVGGVVTGREGVFVPNVLSVEIRPEMDESRVRVTN